MLTASMLIFGTIGIARRFIPLSSELLAFCRGIFGALFLMAFVKVRGRHIFAGLEKTTFAWLAISGGIIGLNWILLFEAYNYTSVSVATLCYYMEPTIVILASALLFREKMTVKKIVCTLLALIGMVLISGAGQGGGLAASESRGIFLGLGAAVLYASVILMNKRIKGIDAFAKTIIQLFFAGAVLLPYLLATGEFRDIPWSARTVLLLILVVIVHTGIAYALYFGSMDGLRTQTVALFSYIDPVTALILSAIVLNEKMTLAGMVGAVLILGSAIAGEM